MTQYRDTIVHILLNGLKGPVGGKEYVAQMVPMDTNADKWIAEVSSYVRNSFGNHGGMIHPEDVARLRPGAKLRGKPWTIAELRSTYPPTVPNAGDWKLTASVNSKEARLAADGDANTRWTSNAQLAPGMWIQIELPQATMIGGVVIDCTGSSNDYARATPSSFRMTVKHGASRWPRERFAGIGTDECHIYRVEVCGSKATPEINLVIIASKMICT